MNTAHLSSTKNTSPLAAFADQQIDWNLTPEMAVTLYLEWGNNDWRSEHPPVRSKSLAACPWESPLSPAVSSILPFSSIKKVFPFSGAVCSGARVAHRYASEAPKGSNARGGFVLRGGDGEGG